MAIDGPHPLRFLISGVVSAWNPVTRVLQIGEHTFWATPDVSVMGMATKLKVTAIGHEDTGTRRVVT